MTDHTHKNSGTVIIKKYANRRLYDTRTSSYVTLEHLCEMVKQGVAFEVHDARSGEDITRSVLLQIIIEEETRGQNLMSIRFLRHLIRFYGDSMQIYVPGYLDLAVENLVRNRDSMRDRLSEALGGNYEALEAEKRESGEMISRVVSMMQPHDEKKDDPRQPIVVREQSARSAEEIGLLKSEIETMRRQMAELLAKAAVSSTQDSKS